MCVVCAVCVCCVVLRCGATGSYTEDYNKSKSDTHTAKKGETSQGRTVEEKLGGHTNHHHSGSGWLGSVLWNVLVLVVGVALGACAARAYGGYERRGEYQQIDRA